MLGSSLCINLLPSWTYPTPPHPCPQPRHHSFEKNDKRLLLCTWTSFLGRPLLPLPPRPVGSFRLAPPTPATPQEEVLAGGSTGNGSDVCWSSTAKWKSECSGISHTASVRPHLSQVIRSSRASCLLQSVTSSAGADWLGPLAASGSVTWDVMSRPRTQTLFAMNFQCLGPEVPW